VKVFSPSLVKIGDNGFDLPVLSTGNSFRLPVIG